MAITIEELEASCSNNQLGLKLGKPALEAFINLQDQNPTNNAYSWAMGAFDNALSWSWLEWHRTGNMKRISDAIGFLVDRVQDVNRLAVNDGLRRLHDIFMLQAAILSSSRKVMNDAAKLAGHFNPGSRRHAYEWGLVGIYRHAILGDVDSMQASYELMMLSRPSPPYRMPSKAVVSTFVAKDDKKLAQTLKRLWKLEWEKLETKEKGILKTRPDEIRVSLRQRGPNDLWPWPEAAFAKLAVMRGGNMPGDSLWCPPDFLNSFIE